MPGSCWAARPTRAAQDPEAQLLERTGRPKQPFACTDGARPVVFKIELVPEEAGQEAEQEVSESDQESTEG